ncbi:ABC transporter ATP-binding protein [Spirochaetia bacterium]|nr:ABC transporter ATP-binding protein [Spirochaetia bacterium]
MKININNINFAFKKNTNPIFKNFSLNLSPDESPVMILGSSGCGKTTLLRIIANMLNVNGGEIIFGGTNDDQQTQKNDLAPKISFIFQEPRLFPNLTVLENVALPLENIINTQKMTKQQSQDRLKYFLDILGLSEKASAYPSELSGGQAGRVSIARAWCYPSELLLMDEPFQSLDIPLRIALLDAVRNLMSIEKRFVIAVTHDPREAIYMGRRIIVLGKTQTGDAKIMLDELQCADGNAEFISEQSIPTEKRLIAALSAGSKK